MSAINPATDTLWDVAYGKNATASTKYIKNTMGHAIISTANFNATLGKIIFVAFSILAIMGLIFSISYSHSPSAFYSKVLGEITYIDACLCFTFLSTLLSLLGGWLWANNHRNLQTYQSQPLGQIAKHLGGRLEKIGTKEFLNPAESGVFQDDRQKIISSLMPYWQNDTVKS